LAVTKIRNEKRHDFTWQCFEDNLIGGYDLFGILSGVQLGQFVCKDASLALSPFLKNKRFKKNSKKS